MARSLRAVLRRFTTTTAAHRPTRAARLRRSSLIPAIVAVLAIAWPTLGWAHPASAPAAPNAAEVVNAPAAVEVSVVLPDATPTPRLDEQAITAAVKAMVEHDASEAAASGQAVLATAAPGFVERYLAPRHELHWAYLACTAFDAGTTAVALAKGAEEVNPMLAPAPSILVPALKIGHYLLVRWLENNDRDANRKMLWLPSSALFCGLGTWNTTQIAKPGK